MEVARYTKTGWIPEDGIAIIADRIEGIAHCHWSCSNSQF